MWRPLVRHLNFQKWSETASFLLTLLTWTCSCSCSCCSCCCSCCCCSCCSCSSSCSCCVVVLVVVVVVVVFVVVVAVVFVVVVVVVVVVLVVVVEGSLEANFPTIWTVEMQSREEAERRERLEERRGRCAKRSESRDSLRFSNDLWLRRVEK